ncbi:MAG TPA: hypothetical protein PLL30_13155 [Candidatus Krumholzibacteria bacterium]|nr:hypothetical protein [Candidatus Krumholzibacteria bacterium]HPD72715.1 hypothetical protein [Candidatus Krumholzibacteria bacterium]HRY40353.1 hypothetical protein [Candidatus Krumholzibacteria bacterium]
MQHLLGFLARSCAVTLALFAILAAGCSDDETSPPPPTGTIIIAPADGLEAPWTLSGPDGSTSNGTGASELDDRAVGVYTIVWGAVGAWTAPPAEVLDLVEGGAITFVGAYVLASADAAMQTFRSAYSQRDLDVYQVVLSHDYQWIPQDGEIYSYDVEIEVANKMFNAVPGEANLIIADIAVDQLDPQGIWQPTPEDDPNFGDYEGSQYRIYIVDIKFALQGLYLIYRVQGPVLFFVLDEGTEDEANYRLLGMVDATFGNKATENHSWTRVKQVFR